MDSDKSTFKIPFFGEMKREANDFDAKKVESNLKKTESLTLQNMESTLNGGESILEEAKTDLKSIYETTTELSDTELKDSNFGNVFTPKTEDEKIYQELNEIAEELERCRLRNC